MPYHTVCFAYRSQNVGKSIIEDLGATFKGHLKMVGQVLDDLEVSPVEADYYILPSQRAVETLKQIRPDARTMISMFTPNLHTLPKLLVLRAGAKCLVVASSRESAHAAVRQLKEFGFGWLDFRPYWRGKHADPDYKIAITLGSANLCPDNISTVIDLGPRRPDIVTLIRLCLDLDLPRTVIDDILTEHFDQITGLGRDYLAMYQESEQDRAYLKAAIDSTRDAIAAFDNNGAVMYSNTLFRRLADGTDLSLSRFLEKPDSTPSVEQVKGAYFVAEKLSVNAQEEAHPIGTLLVLRSTDKVSKAERAVRHAIASKSHMAAYRFSDILGTSAAITKVTATARKVAASDLPIMITGETGTGKELLAHAIHNASSRVDEPFVCAHFAAMTASLIESEIFGYDEGSFTGARKGGKPGYFELAHKGSLFLDEIGDLPVNFQPHLLRVLEDKRIMHIGGNYPIPIDVRLIAATNRDLAALVEQGLFRKDLFYRLNVIPLSLPPLRSRAEDIPVLANHLLAAADKTRPRRFSPEVIGFMQSYSWPGNIRQLGSVVNYMVHTTDNRTLGMEDLPPGLTSTGPEPSPPRDFSEYLKKNGPLVALILSTLARFREQGQSAGQKTLLARARDQNLTVSDYQMRKLLHELNNAGLVNIGSTSQGTAITDKGLNALMSVSTAPEDGGSVPSLTR